MRRGHLQNEGAGARMCQLQPISHSDSKIQNLQMHHILVNWDPFAVKIENTILEDEPYVDMRYSFQILSLKFEIWYKCLILFIVNATSAFKANNRFASDKILLV